MAAAPRAGESALIVAPRWTSRSSPLVGAESVPPIMLYMSCARYSSGGINVLSTAATADGRLSGSTVVSCARNSTPRLRR